PEPHFMSTTESLSCLRDVDREFFAREIDGFLPDRIFDAHCHLWNKEWVPWSVIGSAQNIAYSEYMGYIRDLHGERKTAALFIPYVTADRKDRIPDANAWISTSIENDPDCRGLFFVRPEDDA